MSKSRALVKYDPFDGVIVHCIIITYGWPFHLKQLFWINIATCMSFVYVEAMKRFFKNWHGS